MSLRRAVSRLALVLAILHSVGSPALADDSSGALSPTRVKLPKGPGSLEGVGENAEAQLNQGQATYAVPFSLPAGQQGLTPSLGLSYSSGGGASVVGFGWDLGGLASIERMTVRGLPSFDATDLFAHGGGAELARVTGGSSTQRIYRERFEGSFSRYTWVDAAGNGAAGYWKVETADGRVHYYGADANGAIVPSSRLLGRGGAVFSYSLVESVDPYGHRIRYDYVLDGGRPLLSTVSWGYESLTSNATARYTATLEYEPRPDVLTDGKPGALVSLSQRVSAVRIRVSGALLRRYALTYEPTTTSGGLSRLARVTTYGTDDTTSNPIAFSFRYSRGLGGSCMSGGGAQCLSPVRESVGSVGADFATGDVDFVDMDGDGAPDVLHTPSSGAHRVHLLRRAATGDVSFAPMIGSTVSGVGGALLSNGDVELVDLDGDGRSDLVDRVNDRVLRNGGTSGDWRAAELLDTHMPSLTADANLRFLDVDYDRETDLVHLSPTGAWYFRNLGSGIYAQSATTIDGLARGFAEDGLRLADMNGDGMPDAVQYTPSGALWYFPNLGLGEFGAVVEMDGLPNGWNASNTELVDLSGDGLTDVVRVGDTEVLFVLNQDARSFASLVTMSGASVAGGLPARPMGSSVRFVDMNANGTTDLVYITSSGQVEYVELFRERPNLLVRVDNGIGKRIDLAYDTVFEHMTRDGGNGAWIRELPNPMTVLSRITMSEARTNVPQVQEFFYRNGYWDPQEHQFRGFEEVWVRTPGDAHVETGDTLHTFDVGVTDRYHRGLPLRVETRSAGRVLSVANTEWSDCSVAQATASGSFPVRFICSQRMTTDIVEGLSAAETVRTEETSQFDGYGNKIVTHKLGVVSRGGQACGACTRDTSTIQGEPCGQLCVGDEQHEIVDFIVPGSATGGRWMLRVPYRKRTFGIEGSPEIAEERTYYDGADFVGLPLGTVARGATTRVEQRREAGVDAWRPSQRLAIDEHGNITSQMDANGHTRTFEYGSSGLLVTREQVEFDDAGHAPYSLRMDVTYHPVLEQVVISTAWMRVEGEVALGHPRSTTYAYDPLARIVAIAEPGDVLSAPTQEFAYELGSQASRIISRRRSASGTETADIEAVQCFDGLGRKYQESARIGPGRFQVKATQLYDAHGHVSREYQPHQASNGDCDFDPPSIVLFTDTRRDAAGRVLEVTHPDGAVNGGSPSVERTVYRSLEVEAWDAEDNDSSSRHANTPTRVVIDGLGRMSRRSSLLSPSDSPVTMRVTYDVLGRLRSVVDDAGNEQWQRLDLLGRIVESHHPDSGVTTFNYDDVNNLTERTDARGAITRNSYDEANRIRSTYDAARMVETVSRFRYDGDCEGGPSECPNGEAELVEVTHPLLAGEWARETNGRDIRGRNTRRIVRRGTREYTLATGYDNADRPTSRTFPDGIRVEFVLDGGGRVVRVPGFVNELTYDGRGQLERTFLANGIVSTSAYDERMRLKRTLTSSGEEREPVQDLGYQWDRVGNLLRIVDGRRIDAQTPSENAEYQYDGLYRLSAATLDPGRAPEEHLAYQVDRIGNLVDVTSSFGPMSAAHMGTIRYGEHGAGPHAASSDSAGTYLYDRAGQLVGRSGLVHEWDHQGRLTRTKRESDGNAVTETAYDAEWGRVQQVSAASATEYLADDYEVRDGIGTIYVIVGERPVARVERASTAVNELPDIAPAAATGSRIVPLPDGAITAADAWLLHASASGDVQIDFAGEIPSGRQVNSNVALAGAARRRLLGSDGTATTFQHSDHIGSTNAETDESGAVTQREGSYPYGTPRHIEGTGWARHGHTGMERDFRTGLELHGARWLDSRTGRWLRADPKYQLLTDPDGLISAAAPYGYAGMSPLVLVDPSGMDPPDGMERARDALGDAIDAEARRLRNETTERVTPLEVRLEIDANCLKRFLPPAVRNRIGDLKFIVSVHGSIQFRPDGRVRVSAAFSFELQAQTPGIPGLRIGGQVAGNLMYESNLDSEQASRVLDVSGASGNIRIGARASVSDDIFVETGVVLRARRGEWNLNAFVRTAAQVRAGPLMLRTTPIDVETPIWQSED